MRAGTEQSKNFLWWLEQIFSRRGDNTVPGGAIVKWVVFSLLPIALVFAVDLLTATGAFHHTLDGFYIAAVTVSALYGGLPCGLLGLVWMTLLNVIFHDNPRFVLAVGVYGFEQAVITTMLAGTLVWFTARARQTQERLKNLNTELEARIKLRTEALEESNRQLEAFCYTLAHDLRAPLRAMEGFSHFLLHENGAQLNASGVNYAERICSSSRSMGQLIQDLLAYTQMSKAEFPLEKVSLQTIVERVLAIFSAEIHARNAIIIFESPLPAIIGHLATTEQVVLNLISNALKFVPAGTQPNIRISAETRPETVRLRIEDNGIGIAPVHQKRIFGVFERLHEKEIFPGTGIGLAMGKKGVERMGGKIGVESSPGQGSCFWIELPRAI